MNILIIEDEPLLAEKLEKLLSAEHYAVSIAQDGPSGLRNIWGESYDLILLDADPGDDDAGLAGGFAHRLQFQKLLQGDEGKQPVTQPQHRCPLQLLDRVP